MAEGRKEAAKYVTQKEIARMAGVSVATVSMALHKSPKISQETREIIEKLAQVLKYRPCLMAKGLALAKSWMIGFVSPGPLQNLFYSELYEEIQSQLTERGYLAIHAITNKTNTTKRIIEFLFERRVDGLIFESLTPEETYLLKEERVPFVLTEEPENGISGVDFVTVSKYKGACLAVEHLINLGYKKIAFLCAISSREGRVMGYMDTLYRYRLPIRDDWIIPAPGGYLHTGYEGMKKLLTIQEKPEAIFVHNDVAALGAWRAIKEAGLSIPEDFAMVSFDNIREGEYVVPSLTTVDQPKKKLAQSLVEVLLEKIEQGNGGPAKQVILEPKLIIRGSCGYNPKRVKMVRIKELDERRRSGWVGEGR
jgi:LacI family repressor for deo operon, udp, cdd, tsx, nupC, and nupG